MRKINKNLEDVPKSLIPAYPEFFADSKIPRSTSHTHTKRLEIIAKKSYIDASVYNSRYKLKDVKEKLKVIYKNKCAYCEQKVELSHVEHYRYKNKYYWLAYSWDNLIIACPHCNTNKGSNFELQGSEVLFTNTDDEIKNINKVSVNYDIIEEPKMINPEVTNPESFIKFDKLGKVYSDDVRFDYTINKCKISRTYLNDRRRTILNKLKGEIELCFFKNRESDKIKTVLRHIIENFKNNTLDVEEEFIAFRKFAIDNDWLKEIIKDVARPKTNIET